MAFYILPMNRARSQQRWHSRFLALKLLLGCVLGCFPLLALGDPSTEITHPDYKANVVSPTTIAGTVATSATLDRIDLLIRNELGEYWNGTQFQPDWIAVHPDVNSTDWNYVLDTDVVGNIYVVSRAWNNDGVKQPSASYRPFSLIDTAPNASISYPERRSVVPAPVVISGGVTAHQQLDRIEVKIKNANGEFWNGVNFQSTWVVVPAEVHEGNWIYEFSPDAEPWIDDASRIYVSVKAISIDGDRQTEAGYQTFDVVLPDTIEPVASVTHPLHRAVVQYPLKLSGIASDNNAVDSVNLVLRDLTSQQYWNGSQFQQQWTEVRANLSSGQWNYNFDGNITHKLHVKVRALDTAGNRQSTADALVVDALSCEHKVEGTATPANSGTPTVIDSESISFTTGTVISANFFNSGAIVDRAGRTVSVCVTEGDASGSRRAQIVTDVGQTDNTAIKAYPEFIVGTKFGLVGETSYRPYPSLISSTGFVYPDLEAIAGLTGLPARVTNLPDIDIVVDIDEQNVIGAERDVMIESWFYDISANSTEVGTDAAGNDLANTLNNIVGDGHPNPLLKNLSLEMMVHIGALSPNDVSQARRNPSQFRLTSSPITIGKYHYHIWYGTTELAPLVVYSRETDARGNPSMDLSSEGEISLDWNHFLEFTLNNLQPMLSDAGVSWARDANNIFPALNQTGAIGAVEVGVEPQTNTPDDLPYSATFNKLSILVNGQQFGFE